MSIRRVVHAVTVAGAFACLAPGAGWAQCPSKPKTQDTYNGIAGHAFANHQAEFQPNTPMGGKTYTSARVNNVNDLAAIVKTVIEQQFQQVCEKGSRRQVWSDSDQNIVVIYNPDVAYCGTVFRPTRPVDAYIKDNGCATSD